jgi:hypothetical protein
MDALRSLITVKKRENSFWTRKGPDGKPLRSPFTMREKIFWGIGLGGFGLALVPPVMEYFKKKEDPAALVSHVDCCLLLGVGCLLAPAPL